MNESKSLSTRVLFLIVAILFAAFSLWPFFGNLGDMREFSATAQGTILAPGSEHVERESCGNGCIDVHYCTVEYGFIDAYGTEQRGIFDGRARCSNDAYQPGAQRTVYYDPDNSVSSTLQNPRGIGLNILIIGFMLVCFGMLALAICLVATARRGRS